MANIFGFNPSKRQAAATGRRIPGNTRTTPRSATPAPSPSRAPIMESPFRDPAEVRQYCVDHSLSCIVVRAHWALDQDGSPRYFLRRAIAESFYDSEHGRRTPADDEIGEAWIRTTGPTTSNPDELYKLPRDPSDTEIRDGEALEDEVAITRAGTPRPSAPPAPPRIVHESPFQTPDEIRQYCQSQGLSYATVRAHRIVNRDGTRSAYLRRSTAEAAFRAQYGRDPEESDVTEAWTNVTGPLPGNPDQLQRLPRRPTDSEIAAAERLEDDIVIFKMTGTLPQHGEAQPTTTKYATLYGLTPEAQLRAAVEYGAKQQEYSEAVMAMIAGTATPAQEQMYLRGQDLMAILNPGAAKKAGVKSQVTVAYGIRDSADPDKIYDEEHFRRPKKSKEPAGAFYLDHDAHKRLVEQGIIRYEWFLFDRDGNYLGVPTEAQRQEYWNQGKKKKKNP